MPLRWSWEIFSEAGFYKYAAPTALMAKSSRVWARPEWRAMLAWDSRALASIRGFSASFQQRGKTRLLEMFVAGERFGDSFIAHDNERKTINQGPFLVGALCKEVHAALKKARIGGNDFDAGMVDQRAVKAHKI